MSQLTPLNQKNCSLLAKSIEVPDYQRNSQSVICHIGVGGFHRSHQAEYLHRLLSKHSAATNWGIYGIGLRKQDQKIHQILLKQDFLYSLIEKDADSTKVKIIGSISVNSIRIGVKQQQTHTQNIFYHY